MEGSGLKPSAVLHHPSELSAVSGRTSAGLCHTCEKLCLSTLAGRGEWTRLTFKHLGSLLIWTWKIGTWNFHNWTNPWILKSEALLGLVQESLSREIQKLLISNDPWYFFFYSTLSTLLWEAGKLHMPPYTIALYTKETMFQIQVSFPYVYPIWKWVYC